MSTQPAESGKDHQWQQPDFSRPGAAAPQSYPAQSYDQPPAFPQEPAVNPYLDSSLAPQGSPPPLVTQRLSPLPAPPPSRLETVVEFALRALWPVWAVLVFLGPLHFTPTLPIAIVATILLHLLKRTLAERRRQTPPSPPLPESGPNDLR